MSEKKKRGAGLDERQLSLGEVNESVDTAMRRPGWKRFAAFLGPAYLVSVGYMDPGNWATDIAGGSQFGYGLIWVLVVSNMIALLLQSLSARLGLVTGLDLAQASRAHYPRSLNFFLWILAEIAIAACDLAEVIGMAIGLQLLFKISMLTGVLITVFDTLLLLVLQRFGIRKMEAFIIGLIAITGIAFIAELFFAKPDVSEILTGLKPSIPNYAALYITIGIIGATVMPHNLYLHSSLVQTRKIDRSAKGVWQGIRYNIFDSAIALNLALFVNAAILILAATAFWKNGETGIATISDAHNHLFQYLGAKVAPILFAVALIAAGQSSTLTGTLSGQIVMEGYLNLRLAPWIRRLITRVIAIIPAVFVIQLYGEHKTEELLILSQVILSLQLGFAVVPLIHFVGSKKLMGEFYAKWYLIIPAWISAFLIIGLNIFLVKGAIVQWLAETNNSPVIWFTIVPISIIIGLILLWVILRPFIGKALSSKKSDPHELRSLEHIAAQNPFRSIAVCVDFSTSDMDAISHAIRQGGKNSKYLLIHVTETAGARVMDEAMEDMETTFDEKALVKYREELEAQGYHATVKLGFGNPKQVIPKIISQSDAELLVMGAHGHNFIKDLLLGTTVESVRHSVSIPVLIVRKNK